MSAYKDMAKILIEGPLADDEKQDAGADKAGRDDGDTWQAPNGDIGGKYSGEIRYFDDEDQATAWAKSGKDDSKGDDSDSGDKEKEEPSGKLGTGDFDRDPDDIDDLPEPEDEEPKGKRSDRYKDIDTTWMDDPDAVAAQGQQGRWPGQDEPKGGEPEDEVDGKEYGGKFSEDGDHFFDAVADTAEEGNPQYKELMDADGDYDKFKEGADNLPDGPAKEHLQNMMSHIEAGTYSDEFPSGARGVKAAQAELMDKFRQAATYYDYGEGKEHGRTGKELGKNETLMINGKKYRKVQEQKETSKKHLLRETYERIGGK